MTTKKMVVKFLKDVKKLLSKKGAWARGYFAYDKNGKKVGPTSKEAISFCLLGAAARIDGQAKPEGLNFLRGALPPRFDESIPEYNDHRGRTQKQILALIDRAIRNASKA